MSIVDGSSCSEGQRISQLPGLVAAWALVNGALAAAYAGRRDRMSLLWFVYGAILGPIALLLLHSAPPGRCRTCRTPTRGWLRTCTWCGENVEKLSRSTADALEKLGSAAVPRAPQAAPATVPPPPPERPPTERPVFRLDPEPDRSAKTSETTKATPHPKATAPQPRQAPATAPALDSLPAFDWSAARRTGAPSQAPAAAPAIPPSDAGDVTAIYVTGNSQLEPGRRYGIAVVDGRLRVLGPVDFAPDTVALDRQVAGMEATTVSGRLMISEPGVRGGTMLAFMSIAGANPDQLAAQITREGQDASQTS